MATKTQLFKKSGEASIVPYEELSISFPAVR